ncbi:protein SPT2 homolog [Dreissena polymorpha]|uniref:Protein SPT2 homolog n=1 Tax=Dreissena polymorpha TaxID=45954 RepID=A0A9D4NC82_DREPO|nr:protein SPT2 homolog [Dreissena polymorpha]KAH3891966.1 hypothetical protein DPMN_016076 [Dreissena polymorpha]
MDFNEILSVAHKNQEISKKGKYHGYSTDLSAPKKEKRDKTKRSEVVQKLIEASHPEKSVSKDGSRSYTQQNEKEHKSFQIPKKIKIENLMKDLGSDDDSDNKSNSPRSSSVQSDKGSNLETAHDKQDSYYKHKKHKMDSNDNSVGKHQTQSSSSNHSTSSRNSSSHHSSDRHSGGKNSGNKQNTDRHLSDKHSMGKHSSDKQTIDKHSNGKPTTDKHSSDKHSSERYSSDKNSNDKHINHSDRHSSDKYPSKKSSSDQNSRDIHSDKSSVRSSESRTKSSSTVKDSASSSKKVKAPSELSLEELRKQVFSMKEKEKQLDNLEANQKKTEEKPVISLEKNRQGVADTDAYKKACILAMMQEKKERMKAKLEEEKASNKPHKERGKRSGDKERISDKMGHKVKSKSTVKDDYDSDDDIPAGAMDMSFNSSLLDSGCVDMKSIKKKIDEKLSNYNFEDKPEKEKKYSKRSPSNKNDKKSFTKLKDKHKKSHSGHNQHQSKAEKMKSLMRNDYKSNFSGNDHKEQRKLKKPGIVRRAQFQPPPPKFEDLLKLAEQKSKEVPLNEPLKPVKPKKIEERPMTQEEIERRQRAEDHRKRREDEKAGILKHVKPEMMPASKGDSSMLKSALIGKPDVKGNMTGKSDVKGNQTSSKKPPGLSSVQKPSISKKKYDVESESVIVCQPAGVEKKMVKEDPGLNPFDRIVSQFKKTTPKLDKRKMDDEPMFSDYDDEEDEYDEDDDFIDDGGDTEDVSAHIRSIFGYDKRKYRFEDSDDENMEANFTTIMKEEARSAKIGRMEDLEDIRREEEELKRKMKAKKMRR